MTIIHSFLTTVTCMGAAMAVHAQEMKMQIAKPAEIKMITPPEINPPATPILFPRYSVEADKKEESGKPQDMAKPVALTMDADAATKKLKAEQLKTLNGTAEKTKHLSAIPGTPGEKAKPAAVITTIKENR